MSNWNSSPHPLSDIRDWSNSGRLELRPEFQRKEVWALPAKIMLIDSITRGVPLPKVFLANEIREDRTYRKIIDGQQRITAILEFMRDGFALDTPYEGEHAGKRFSDFISPHREQFLAYKIDFAEASNASEREIRDVYMRVNKYTIPLNKQELRRADFPGDFLNVAEELSVNDDLDNIGVFTATDRRRYADAEYVSELLAGIIDGAQDKKVTLDTYYQRYATWEEPGRSEIRNRFLASVRDLKNIFSSWPLGMRATRFRQKADFYSILLAVDSLRQSDGSLDDKDLGPLREDLRLLTDYIAPTSDVPILSEYAIKCVSQANSVSSRRWRSLFLRTFLGGTYLGKPPVDQPELRLLYRTADELAAQGLLPQARNSCISCGHEISADDSPLLAWKSIHEVFQLSNSAWSHRDCQSDDWVLLPRPAVEAGEVP